jgi:hypothetical protein
VIQKVGVLRNKTAIIKLRFMQLGEGGVDCDIARTSYYSNFKIFFGENLVVKQIST